MKVRDVIRMLEQDGWVLVFCPIIHWQLVLLGIWASPLHNGGAYGDGTAESGVWFWMRSCATAESLANSRSLPAGLVRRAKIILLSASGKTNVEIARQLETSKVTVSLWRCRFLRQGVSGLYDELRRAAHARLATSEWHN